MQRTASAHWSGGLKDGKGTVSTQSGVLSQPSILLARVLKTASEQSGGADRGRPRGLLFDGALRPAGKRRHDAESIDTNASLTLDKTDAGFSITAVHLEVKVKSRCRPSEIR